MPQMRLHHPPPLDRGAATVLTSTERTAAHRLFHDHYICLIAQAHLYSKKHLDVFGMVTTGDKVADRAAAMAMRQVQLTPAGMAMYMEEGANFTLVDGKDSVPIYQALLEHLTDWKAYVAQEYNPLDIPIEDLRMFDNLAAEMYQIAKVYMAIPQAAFGFFNTIQKFERQRGVQRAPKTVDGVDVSGPIVPATHTPIADTIQQGAIFGQPRRKPWSTKRGP